MTIKKGAYAEINHHLLSALVSLKEMVPQLQDNRVNHPFSRSLGICANVYYHLQTAGVSDYEIKALMQGMRDLVMTWPKRDKTCEFYPVGGYDEYTSEMRMKKMWLNERRLALLDWLIKSVAEQLEQEMLS